MPDQSSHEPDPIPLNTVAADKTGALQPQDSVETAGVRLREHAATAWPVAENRKLVGMVDEQNPDWELGGKGHDPKTWQVGEIMNRDVFFCYEDDDSTKARQVMDEHNLRFLPVVDRQMRIVSILSYEEIEQTSTGAKTIASTPGGRPTNQP